MPISLLKNSDAKKGKPHVSPPHARQVDLVNKREAPPPYARDAPSYDKSEKENAATKARSFVKAAETVAPEGKLGRR